MHRPGQVLDEGVVGLRPVLQADLAVELVAGRGADLAERLDEQQALAGDLEEHRRAHRQVDDRDLPGGIHRLSITPKVPKSVTIVSRATPPTLRLNVGWFRFGVEYRFDRFTFCAAPTMITVRSCDSLAPLVNAVCSVESTIAFVSARGVPPLALTLVVIAVRRPRVCRAVELFAGFW
jgi:hypothetical protein